MDPLAAIKASIQHDIDKKYEDSDYIESYVAFLDILGMKNLLDKEYQEIRSIFNVIEASETIYKRIGLSSGESFISQNQIRLLVMSDSIVISIAKNTDHSFSKLIGISSYIIKEVLGALSEPIFIRGGIARGDIYQDESTVFGPALSEAYRLETEDAKSMRCVISKELYNDQNFKNYIKINKSLIRDNDEFFFIDFVNTKNWDELFVYSKEVLASESNEHIRKKYKWLISYLERWKYENA